MTGWQVWFLGYTVTAMAVVGSEVYRHRKRPESDEFIHKHFPNHLGHAPAMFGDFVFGLLGWPIWAILFLIAAREKMSPLENIARMNKEKAEKAQAEFQQKRAQADSWRAQMETERILMWSSAVAFDQRGDSLYVRWGKDFLPAFYMARTEAGGAIFVWRMNNTFDNEKEEPYARFSTWDEARSFCEGDKDWLRIRLDDLSKILAGLTRNHLSIHIKTGPA